MKNTPLNLYSEHLEKFIDIAFEDLVEIAKSNATLFEELYYNRKSQCQEFHAMINEEHQRAPNALIVGGAGVGKTSFMHKLLINCDREKVYPIFLDYRRIVPRTKDGLLGYFLSEIEKYFNAIAHPINTISNANSIDQNFQNAYSHLESINKDKNYKLLVLFLDDFDYAEDEWSELLKYFLPFSNSPKITLVLSVRPQLFNSIDEYDDRYRYGYIRKARKIDLAPISVEHVISMRLAPVLLEHSKTNKIYGMIQSLFSRESELCKIAKNYGTILDNLPRFEYPLTVRHNTFMQRIASGDLREIFAIALESLRYTLKNSNDLESRVEEEITRKVIGREKTLELLYDNKDSGYLIINLNKIRSISTGNSLFFNVLEGIKYFESNNEKFYDLLKKLGHTEEKVDDAIKLLSSRHHKFFVESKISLIEQKPKKTKKAKIIREYCILPKLEIYLEMAKDWPEYITRCGTPGESMENYIL